MPPPNSRKTRRLVGIGLLIAGVAVAFGGPLVSLIQTFDAIEEASDSGEDPTPDELATGIRKGQLWFFLGLALALAGIVVLVLGSRARRGKPAPENP